jgi:hypothetical protein
VRTLVMKTRVYFSRHFARYRIKLLKSFGRPPPARRSVHIERAARSRSWTGVRFSPDSRPRQRGHGGRIYLSGATSGLASAHESPQEMETLKKAPLKDI